MNPYKPGHQIPCAHCAADPASGECAGCRRPVCARCIAEPAGCRSPRAISVKLGRGARVRAIGSDGQRVVVSGWRGFGRPTLRDLASGKSLETADVNWLGGRSVVVGVGTSGDLIAVSRGRERRATLCTCGDHVVRVYSDETLDITRRGDSLGARQETLRGKVLERVAYDCEGRQLLVGTRDLVALYACDESHRVANRLGRVTLRDQALAWMALRRGCALIISSQLAYAVVDGALVWGYEIRAFRTHAEGIHSLPFYERKDGQQRDRGARSPSIAPASSDLRLAEPICAALSASGEQLAVALDHHAIALIGLESGSLEEFNDHRPLPCFIAFTRDHLVSADTSGRLIRRERDGESYSRWMT